nr:DsbA family protein [uncultured Anaeromusa sp.]
MHQSLRVVFDFACPYCYLLWGYVRELRRTAPVQVEWLPWEINPEMESEGRALQPGTPGVSQPDQLGASLGLVPSARTIVANTHQALAVLEFAKDAGKGDAWLDTLFPAYFAAGKDISQLPVLLPLAQKIGLDSLLLAEALQAGRYDQRLLDNEVYCQEHQIEWVPTVLWGQEKLLEGVISFSVFKDTLKTLF